MTSNCGQIWTSLSEVIRQRISADGFERWFQGVDVVSDDGTKLVLGVPNPIHQFFIESNYLPLVQDAAAEILGSPRKVQFVAVGAEETATVAAASNHEAQPARVIARERVQSPATSGMNPRNTFDTFVVGSNNQFAHSAALAIAKTPAKTYNPFFVYGGSGLGKTHLLQAIGHYILQNQKSAKVVYLSSEQFTNEFIDAIQHGSLVKF
ncbi:MAG: DnaA ATPase domain-containing protein, partial [Terrimicrobiaceae bacterium]